MMKNLLLASALILTPLVSTAAVVVGEAPPGVICGTKEAMTARALDERNEVEIQSRDVEHLFADVEDGSWTTMTDMGDGNYCVTRWGEEFNLEDVR